jgi:hypothetical protein
MWKGGILRDLHEVGLRGRLPVFIAGFLLNRHFRVRIGSCLSNAFNHEMGVPLGYFICNTLPFKKE